MHRMTVQVVQNLRPGGIGSLVVDLSEQSIGGGSTIVVCLEGGREETLARWPRLRGMEGRLLFVQKQSGVAPLLPWRLARVLRAVSATAVHSHSPEALIYGGVAARLTGAHLVHTVHASPTAADGSEPLLDGLVPTAAVRLLRPVVVADARAAGMAYAQSHGRTVDAVIPVGINVDHYRPLDKATARDVLGLPASAKVIGTAGPLEAPHAHRDLLSVLAGLEGPDGQKVHLAIAGTGSLQESLRRLASAFGVQNQVHFLGDGLHMPSFFSALDLFCLPGVTDNPSRTLLKAQACGTPVVSSLIGTAAEAVHAETGLMVPLDDAPSLATALAAVVKRQPGSFRSPRSFAERVGDRRTTAAAYSMVLYPATPMAI